MAGETAELKRQIRRAMADLGMHDMVELSTNSGVKPRTLTNILSGRPSRSRESLERALGWEAGSIEAILAGGQATPRPETSGETPSQRTVRDPLIEAIDSHPELSAADKNALRTHYAGLLAFARQRHRLSITGPPFDPPPSDHDARGTVDVVTTSTSRSRTRE